MPDLFANLTKNGTIPDVAGGILFTDDVNEVFYLWGGEYSDTPQPVSAWSYDAILNQWNLTTTPPSQINWTAYGAGTTVSARGEGYYYGGYMNNQTTPAWSGDQVATSNLIKYDMIANVWTSNNGPLDGIGRAEGVCSPIVTRTSRLRGYRSWSPSLHRMRDC